MHTVFAIGPCVMASSESDSSPQPITDVARKWPISVAMERGLYIAASGMLSDIARQDAIAANLANVNTVGYKGDELVNESFTELFLTNIQNGRHEGGLPLGTRIAGAYSNMMEGPLHATPSDPYAMAIGGDGFFMIRTGAGIQYTRNGEFSKSPEGYLVNGTGDFVLDSNRQPIFIGSGEGMTVQKNGTITNGSGALIGNIGVVTLDPDSARKVGANMWTGTETGGQPGNTVVMQRFLESSNVNPVLEMVEMISTLRSYESAQRAITAIDGTLDKAVNSVGTLG